MEWTETGRFPCRFAQPDLVPVKHRGNLKSNYISNGKLNCLDFRDEDEMFYLIQELRADI